jgi:two-component system phosphate regulon sensor histidine kinase PhoR
MKPGLSGKILVVFLLIGAVVVAFFSIVVSGQIKKDLFLRFEEEMTVAGRIIAMMPQEKIAANIESLAKASHSRLTLINAAGKVVADTMAASEKMDSHLHRSEIQEARLRGVGTARRYSRTLGQEMIYVVVPLGDRAGGRGYIRLSRPASDVSMFSDKQARTSLYFMLALIALYILTAMLFFLRLLNPIRRMAAFTDRIRDGRFPGSLLIRSDGEIAGLAKNINEMVESLQDKIRKADEEKQKLESVFAGMNEGVMLLDSENRIESVNQSMEGALRRPPADMLGRTILEVCHNAELHDALAYSQKTLGLVCKEISLGEEAPLVMDVTISTAHADTRNERKTILVFHDVTHLKQLERIRTDFIANATHEIRTPLTAIIGFTETLQQGSVENSETAKKFLRTIRENAERLNRLVDDLKTLSRLELGEENLKPEELSVKDEMEKVMQVVGAMAAQKKIEMRNDIPESLPPAFADKDRMTQILINILDNAIKFTPEGGSVSITASGEEENLVAIKIADTGPGIPAADISRLGERFFRVDKTRSRDLGGTGLGLSIVKHLMKAHKGRMEIKSVLGSGTAVLLFFPVFKREV